MLRRAVSIPLIFLAAVAVCAANEDTIVYSGIQKAHHLSGVVRDSTGAPLEQVEVQEMSNDWSKVLQQTMTDAQGHWTLPVLPQQKTHNIRLVKYLFHRVQFRVRLNWMATKPLDFALRPW